MVLLGSELAYSGQIPFGFMRTKANRLSITTSTQTLLTGLCSAVVTVQYQGPGGTAKNVSADLTVNIGSVAGVTYYSDANCLTPITSFTILNGTSAASFYFIGDTTGSKNISVSTATNLIASQSETLNTNPFLWTGGGGNANWSTVANWSGGVAPGLSDTALFNGTCSSNCSPNITANISVGGVRIASSYASTITQNSGITLTIGAQNWVQLAGTFAGSNAAFTINGALIITGGSFTLPQNTLSVNNGLTILNTPTITATSSTLQLGCSYGVTCQITPGAATYNHVIFQGTYAKFNLGGHTMTVAGNLSVGDNYGASEKTKPIDSGTINVGGNISVINNGNQGSVLIVATGNASGQTITGTSSLYLPGIKIAAGSNSVTLSSDLNIAGSFIVSSVGTLTPSTNLKIFCSYGQVCTLTPGSTTYNNLVLTSFYGNFDLGGSTFNVSGNFSAGDTYGIGYNGQQINSGTIMVHGNISTLNYGYQGSASIVAAGNASGQTISGTASGPSYSLPNLTIAACTNPVSLSGTVSISQSFTMTSVGTFTTTGSTLYINCVYGVTCTITPGAATYNNVTLSGNYSTFTLGGNTMNVGGNFTFGDTYGPGYLDQQINSGTFNVTGNITAANYGNKGTAVIVATGNASGQTITASSSIWMPNFRSNAGANAVSMATDLNVAGTLTVSSGNLGMAGHALNVLSTLTISSGASLTKSSGFLSYGSLSNSGTINP